MGLTTWLETFGNGPLTGTSPTQAVATNLMRSAKSTKSSVEEVGVGLDTMRSPIFIVLPIDSTLNRNLAFLTLASAAPRVLLHKVPYGQSVSADQGGDERTGVVNGSCLFPGKKNLDRIEMPY